MNEPTGRRTEPAIRRSLRPAPRPRVGLGGPRRIGGAELRAAADRRLRWYRRRTSLAVALTGIALLLWGAPEVTGQSTGGGQRLSDTATAEAARSVQQATGTIRELAVGFYALLPKLGIALVVVLMAAVLHRAVGAVLRRLLRTYRRADALAALAGIAIWVLAIGVAVSVLAGDIRTLIGSLGLIGLALSWALQSPIESFTGWLLNSFRGYYQVGDRVAVGDVFGDVYRIDFLTTTVWEAGGPDKPVQGAQPTGALITFPNSEVLHTNVTNYTRDFPYVWDEVTVGVSSDSDLEYAARLVEETAYETLGAAMAGPAAAYETLLRAAELDFDVSARPQVYVTLTDSWSNLTVRYLVAARERRLWSSRLLVALSSAIGAAEHAPKVRPAFPRRQVELLGGEARR